MVQPPHIPSASLSSTSCSSPGMQDYVHTTRSTQGMVNERPHMDTMSGPSSPSSQSSWSTCEKFYYQHPHHGAFTSEPQQDDAQAGYPWQFSGDRKFSGASTSTYHNSNQDDDEYPQQYDDDEDYEQAKHYHAQQGHYSHAPSHRQHEPRRATHPSSKSRSGPSRSKHMNAHTTCGRHSDQWLFQGWRVPSILKGKRRRNKDSVVEEEEEEEEEEVERGRR